MNKRHVQEGHEQVRQALAEYCVSAHPQIQVIKLFIIPIIFYFFTLISQVYLQILLSYSKIRMSG